MGRLEELAERSVEIILANQAPSGAYMASPTFPVYRFSWLRDGAFIADAMSRVGHLDSPVSFLHWCRRVVEARLDQIDDLVRRRTNNAVITSGEYLHTRYTLDGGEGTDEWWNHQLDGYGAWLWGLGSHASRWSDFDLEEFTPAVEATADYLVAFWDAPCYDCWEENGDRVHVATLAAVAAGLRVAAEWAGASPRIKAKAEANIAQIKDRIRERGTRDGHLVKWLEGDDVDSSLLFCAIPYRLFPVDDPLIRATVDEIEKRLVHQGVYRHPYDTYYGGGEWVLLTALLGSYKAAVGDVDDAWTYLKWVAAQANGNGWLPEQVSTHLLHPERFGEWEQRWGPVASPLLWSHAMYLNLHHDLVEKG